MSDEHEESTKPTDTTITGWELVGDNHDNTTVASMGKFVVDKVADPELIPELSQTGEYERTSEIWGGITDPAEHNPAHFRYLVYGFNPTSAGGLDAAIGGDERSESTGDQSVNLYYSPEELNQRISISMSLIDQNHSGTWGQGGLIIEAPAKNIVITSKQDNGTANSNYARLVGAKQQTPIISGDELLERSSDDYNEVVAVPSIEGGGELKLTGFFYKTNRRGQPLDYSTYVEMKTHSDRLKLPLVPIQEKVYDHPDGVSIESDYSSGGKRMAIYLDNVRYLVGGFDETRQFCVAVDGRGIHFASPDEIRDMIERTLAAGHIDEATAKKITADYNEANRKRSIPVVEFEEDGSVSGIRKKIGYGNSEVHFTIGKFGRGYTYNVVDKNRYQMSAMSVPNSNNVPSRDLSWQDRLTKYQMQDIITEAIDNLPEEQANIVREWWQTVAPPF